LIQLWNTPTSDWVLKRKSSSFFAMEKDIRMTRLLLRSKKEFHRIVAKGAIYKIVGKYNMTGSVENFASPGRPEFYSKRYKRELDRVALKNND